MVASLLVQYTNSSEPGAWYNHWYERFFPSASTIKVAYAHVLDDDRRKNAQRLEQAFYQKKEPASSLADKEQPATSESTEDRLSIIMKLLSDPQTAELLKVLVNKV